MNVNVRELWDQKKKKIHTDFQPSGSVQAVILVLMPGNGPGSRVICPPFCLTTSAVLYTSSVPIAIWKDKKYQTFGSGKCNVRGTI